MIDFARAWSALSPGDELQVSNGAPEPAEADSIEHRVWCSHNFSGVLAEKIDGPPRAFRIDREVEAGTIGYTIVEGGGHQFAPTIITPQLAHDCQWEAAKAYSDARALTFFTMPGVGPIQTDEKSLMKIGMVVDEARDRIAAGEPEWTAEFLNKDNETVVVTAAEVLLIERAIRGFFGEVHRVRQLHRAALKAALDAGETAEAITAIDITAGYPA